jgi:DNA polymerase-3 subunit gamma/tau
MQNYQVLPLKYRPQSLDEIWVQEHIKTTLKRAIESNRVAHAYIFAGPRGVGKTTTARVLAKSLNCIKGPTVKPCQECSVCKEITNSSSLDVLEIDGASNRGIDQVRELRENVKFLPTSCPYKIYIIDEVHMLTPEAFNALLKTLEEPPQHVKFIFATTAPQKVPATILSRCQRFDFRKATVEEVVQRLAWICEKEKIDISEEAMFAIGKRADGAIRDAESMLDQLRVYQTNRINLKDVEDLLGIISLETFFEYTENLIAGDQKLIFEFIDKIFSTGYDFMEFYSGLLEHFRLLLMVKLNIGKNILGVSHSEIKKYENQAKKFSVEKLLIVMQFIADSEDMVKRTAEPKILFEILSLNLLNTLSNSPKPEIKSANSTTENSDVKIAWQNLISEFSEKRPFLSNHLETAIISELIDDMVVITFNEKSDKDYVESEKTEIERCFGLLLGKTVKVILTCSTDEKSTKTNVEPKATVKSSKSDDVDNSAETSKPTAKSKPSIDPDKIFKQIFPDGKKIK